MIVVRVEATLTDGHRAGGNRITNGRAVALEVESGGIMWMDTRREPHESRMSLGNRARAFRGRDGFPYANESARTGQARALDYRVAIVVECRIAQMDVAVDERRHLAAYRAATVFGLGAPGLSPRSRFR